MINEIYAKLTKEQQELLNYAFENKIAQLVELEDHRFIGVNLITTPHLIIQEEKNKWSVGILTA